MTRVFLPSPHASEGDCQTCDRGGSIELRPGSLRKAIRAYRGHIMRTKNFKTKDAAGLYLREARNLKAGKVAITRLLKRARQEALAHKDAGYLLTGGHLKGVRTSTDDPIVAKALELRRLYTLLKLDPHAKTSANPKINAIADRLKEAGTTLEAEIKEVEGKMVRSWHLGELLLLNLEAAGLRKDLADHPDYDCLLRPPLRLRAIHKRAEDLDALLNGKEAA